MFILGMINVLIEGIKYNFLRINRWFFFLKGFIIDFKKFCLLYFMIVFKEYLEFLKLNMKKINDIFMFFLNFDYL